jgi:hypothetical protein
MSEIANGIVYGLAGIGVYELADIRGIAFAAAVVSGVVIVALASTGAAWWLGARRPLLTTLLIETMPTSGAAVAIGGTGGALLILASIAVIKWTGSQPSGDVKAISDAIGAILTLAVSFLAKLGERASPAAFARRFVWARYREAFPELPEDDPELTAYRKVREAYTGDGSWGIVAVRDRLAAIKRALSVSASEQPAAA